MFSIFNVGDNFKLNIMLTGEVNIIYDTLQTVEHIYSFDKYLEYIKEATLYVHIYVLNGNIQIMKTCHQGYKHIFYQLGCPT